MEYIDDNRLCELAANGELTAIEMLYKRHYELMLNFGLKYSDDNDFVMDCIQDLFEKLICHPSLFSREICEIVAADITSEYNFQQA